MVYYTHYNDSYKTAYNNLVDYIFSVYSYGVYK